MAAQKDDRPSASSYRFQPADPLRMESGGHGFGQSLDRAVDLTTDIYAFLFDRLGLGYQTAAETS
jgi:hypothetical protein